MSFSEAQIESQLRDLFTRQRHLPIKTEAGSQHSGATLPAGWPDLTVLLPLPGLPYALVTLVEVKTAKGKLRDSQVSQHAALRLCDLEPQIIRSTEEAQVLIDRGLALRRQIMGGNLLKPPLPPLPQDSPTREKERGGL